MFLSMKLLYLFPLLLVASTNANYCGIVTSTSVGEPVLTDNGLRSECKCLPGYRLTKDGDPLDFDTWYITVSSDKVTLPSSIDGADCTEIPGNSGSQKALGSALGVSCALATINYMS